MSIIKKSTSKELIAARFMTLSGELYRIPVAIKTTTTVITDNVERSAPASTDSSSGSGSSTGSSDGSSGDVDDNGTIIMEGQESIKGIPYTFYTTAYVKIEKPGKINKTEAGIQAPDAQLITYQNKTMVYEPMFFIPISGEPKAVAKAPIPSLILEVTGYYDKVKSKDLIGLKITETDSINWQSARVVDSTKQIKTYTL